VETAAVDAPAETSPEASCGTGAAAEVAPVSLAFGTGGLVNCGSQAQSQPVTIKNNSCSSFTWMGTLTSGSTYYQLSPNMGTIPAGGTQVVQVIPAAIPSAGGEVSQNFYGGTVAITTSAPGDSSHVVQLNMSGQGVILKISLTSQAVAFGGVSIGQTGSSQFSVTNVGNVATTVSFATGSAAFSVTPSFSIGANEAKAPVVTFSPTMVQPYQDSLITSVPQGTPLCAALPPTIALSGSGTTGVAVQPTNLSFGPVQCNQPAAAFQTVTITNNGAATTYTPTLNLGVNSPYTLADSNGTPLVLGTAVVLGAGPSSATIRVVPNPVKTPSSTAPDALADTLVITTTSASDQPHNISLHETAQGAILTLAPTAVTVNSAVVAFQSYTVGNTGNYSAGFTITAATTQGPANTFTANLTSGTLSSGVGGTQSGQLTIQPPPMGSQYLGTLTLAAAPGAILCQDLPPATPLSVTH